MTIAIVIFICFYVLWVKVFRLKYMYTVTYYLCHDSICQIFIFDFVNSAFIIMFFDK